MMCIDFAEGIRLQCRHEYGFSDENEGGSKSYQFRQTNKEELKDMPTNNICAEEILLNSVILQSLQSL